MKRLLLVLPIIAVLFIASCTPKALTEPPPLTEEPVVETATEPPKPTPTMTAMPTEDPHEVIVREVDENVDFLPWYPMPVSSTLEDGTVIKYEWTNPMLLVEIAGENLGTTTLEDGETKSFTFRGIKWTLYVKIENGMAYVSDAAVSANFLTSNLAGRSVAIGQDCTQTSTLTSVILYDEVNDFLYFFYDDTLVAEVPNGKETEPFLAGYQTGNMHHAVTACPDGTYQVIQFAQPE